MTEGSRVQLDSDCEGPTCHNDNAFEVCAHYLCRGDVFFTQVSRYDDYLADVVRRPGYQAGTTLKLIAPFLKAFGLTNRELESFSESSLDLMKGAEETFKHVKGLGITAFEVSTSYEQFAHAVAERLGIPRDNTYCTPLDLDGVTLPSSEKSELQQLAAEITDLPTIELSEGNETLAPSVQDSIAFLEELFWQKLPAMKAQAIIDSVRLLGAKGKVDAIRSSLMRTGNRLQDVVYVGDSITDVKAFDFVREGGGLAVSFNGNRYAIDAAEIACAADDAIATSIVVDVFARHGKAGVFELANAWPQEQAAQVQLLRRTDVAPAVVSRLQSLETRGIGIYSLTGESKARVREQSMEMRVLLRGRHIGALG